MTFYEQKLDRVLSYGVLAVLALILDAPQLYDESVVLKHRDVYELPKSEKFSTYQNDSYLNDGKMLDEGGKSLIRDLKTP